MKTSAKIFLILQNKYMTDPILYISMFLGFGGIYVLISSFHDDDDDDDGEKFTNNLEYNYQQSV